MSSEPQDPDDRAFEDFLEGRSPLSAAYREASSQAGEGVPPEVDASILARAREAARPPRAVRRVRIARVFAMAATVVVAFGVVLTVTRDPALRGQAVPGAEVRESRARPESAAAPGAGPAQGGAMNQAPAAPMTSVRPADDGSMDELSARRAESARDARAAGSLALPKPAPEKKAMADKPTPFPGGALSSQMSAAPAAAAPPLPPSPPPPPPLSAPAPSVPAPSPPAMESRGAGGDGVPERAKEKAPASVAAEPQAAKRDAAAASIEQESSLTMKRERDAGTDPDPWLTQIRKLREAGDEVGAKREFGRWRAAFPDREVPEDLRDLL